MIITEAMHSCFLQAWMHSLSKTSRIYVAATTLTCQSLIQKHIAQRSYWNLIMWANVSKQKIYWIYLRQALEVFLELLVQILDIFCNVRVGPFTAAQVLCEWKQFGNKHGCQIVGWSFFYQILLKRWIGLSRVSIMLSNLHGAWLWRHEWLFPWLHPWQFQQVWEWYHIRCKMIYYIQLSGNIKFDRFLFAFTYVLICFAISVSNVSSHKQKMIWYCIWGVDATLSKLSTSLR